ncbi:MAG: hypothetical protein ABSA86_08405, partial [Oryzomonas sp.]
LADNNNFKNTIETLSQSDKDEKGDEELVLRFFATKNVRDIFRGNVRDWLDDYMENIILEKTVFDYAQEKNEFERLFYYLDDVIGSGAFVKYRGDSPIGGLAPAYYEAVSIGTYSVIDQINTKDQNKIKQAIITTVQSADFRNNTGPAANTRPKLEARIRVIGEALLQA